MRVMSENSSSHAASHQRLRRAKQAIVLAVAGTTAAVWALVATNTVGVTSTTAADARSNTGSGTTPPQVRTDGQGQDGGGFFGTPNEQPGFFGGNDGFGQGGFGQNGFSQGGSGSSGSGTFGGGFGQGGFGQNGFSQGGSGSSGNGTFGGGFGPMMQSGGS